jgi:hypothetical protein
MPTKKTPTTKKQAPTKKSAPQKAADKKKAPAKKRTPKTKSKKSPIVAEGTLRFWVSDGSILSHMMDLLNAVQDMDSEVFEYHAQGDTNDFALWVEHVLCDADCAQKLTKAKSQKQAEKVLSKYVTYYIFE